MKKILPALLLIALAWGCRKDEPQPEPPAPEEGGTVNLVMKHTVGGQDLQLGTWYLSPSADSFKVSRFYYYISNIVLVADQGTSFVQPESYALIKHGSQQNIMVSDVPAGTYNKIRLMIGVDSLRNTSGAQSGALDPAHGMFWNWNSGYIFMKLEGESPRSGAASKALTFHLGGFTGENKAQRSVELPLTTPVSVNKNTVTVNLKVDVNEIFTSPHNVDFSTLYYQMSPGPNARILADNYSDMISVQSVQN